MPPVGYDRVHQAWAKVARLAKVTGGRDRETFSLALTCHFASIFPCVFLARRLLQVLFFFPVPRGVYRETGSVVFLIVFHGGVPLSSTQQSSSG